MLRYVDTMQELNDPTRFHERDQYSSEEARLVRLICDRVVQMTKSRYGRPVRPWQGPLTTMNMFRAVQEIARLAGKASLNVFEVGPGAGTWGRCWPWRGTGIFPRTSRRGSTSGKES